MKKVKRYEYEEIHYEQFRQIVEIEDYREIINKHAELGHSYVGYIPTQITIQGRFNTIDLIFEVNEN